jgi:hypothetical protein
MSTALRAGIAAAILATINPVAAHAASTAPASTAIVHTSYFLINGPDFREVSEAVFNSERSSCLRIDVKDYPEDHVREYHCYL